MASIDDLFKVGRLIELYSVADFPLETGLAQQQKEARGYSRSKSVPPLIPNLCVY